MSRLDHAVALLKSLPDQERAANALIAFADEHTTYTLTDDQIDGIDHAIAQADGGQFAGDDQIAAIFGEPLLCVVY